MAAQAFLPTVAVAAALCLAGVAKAHPLIGTIIDVAAGQSVDSLPALAKKLRRADVLILGEIHDNPAHHAGQAELVAETAPKALAFEMIAPGDEGLVARLRAERAPAAVLGEALQWETSGWPDFAMYAPIFEAAPRAEITGGAVDGASMRLAMEQGAARAATEALGYGARRYGLDTPLPAAVQADAEREQIRVHCDAIPAEIAGRMVEAQRLRDVAFADAVLRARALVDGGRVALITGRGHARLDRGVPAVLEAVMPGLSVVSVGFMEVNADATSWQDYADRSLPLHDYLVFTAAAEREDPCIAFMNRRR